MRVTAAIASVLTLKVIEASCGPSSGKALAAPCTIFSHPCIKFSQGRKTRGAGACGVVDLAVVKAPLRACVLALALAACSGGNGNVAMNDGGALTCNVDAPTSCPGADAPTWETVAPIVGARCAPCHYGQPDGPWPLITYQHVVDWYDVVRSDLIDCSMPPADGGVTMTDEERHTILTWLRCDTPK
jgi:hypothetical protein